MFVFLCFFSDWKIVPTCVHIYHIPIGKCNFYTDEIQLKINAFNVYVFYVVKLRWPLPLIID